MRGETIRLYTEDEVRTIISKHDRRKAIDRKRKIHNEILGTLDAIAVISWMLGASAIDCPTNDMRVVYSMIIIPLIWGALRAWAERNAR